MRVNRKLINPALYQAVVDAEQAARKAYNLAYDLEDKTPFLLRTQLGRAQSLLMHNVVKYASRH